MSTSGIGRSAGSVGRPDEGDEAAAPEGAQAAGAPEAAEAAPARGRGGKAAPAKAGAGEKAPGEAKAARRPGSSGIDSTLLRTALEGRVPAGHGAHARDAARAAALPSGRDAVHGAAVHAAQRRSDPSADTKLLSGARHDQRALLADCRSVAKDLGLKLEREGSKSAVSSSGRGRAEASGRSTLDADGLRAEGRASASYGAAGRRSGAVDGRLGSASGSIAGEAQAYARADGRASVGKDGLKAQGSAEVGVRVRVEVDGEFRTKGVRIGGERLDVNGKIHGEAEVSAYARVDADVAATQAPPRLIVVANAKAFAGAKAAAHGSIGLGDFVRVNASAEAWAGAGAEAGVVAGYDDGKLRLGFNAGAAVGVGAGFSFCVEIDVKKIAGSLISAATGGLIDIDVLFDRGDGSPPIQLAQIELMFPPYVESTGAAGAIEVDRAQQTIRFEERKRERDAAERHVRAAVTAKAGRA